MSYSGLDTSFHPCRIQVSGPKVFLEAGLFTLMVFLSLFRGPFQFCFELVPYSGHGITPAKGQVTLLLIFGGWIPNSSSPNP